MADSVRKLIEDNRAAAEVLRDKSMTRDPYIRQLLDDVARAHDATADRLEAMTREPVAWLLPDANEEGDEDRVTLDHSVVRQVNRLGIKEVPLFLVPPSPSAPVLSTLIDRWKKRMSDEGLDSLQVGLHGDDDGTYDHGKADMLDLCIQDLEDFARSVPPSPSVPEAWMLVLVEPTADMIAAALDLHEAHERGERHPPCGVDHYRAMLAAAPKGVE